MSHWNNRVVRRTYPSGEVMLGIHEAFCDDAGRVWGITQDPISPRVEENDDENIESLKEVLGWMLKACDAPILDYDSIPEEGAVSPGWTENLDEDEDLLDLDELMDEEE